MLEPYLDSLFNEGADALQLVDGAQPVLFFGEHTRSLSEVLLPSGTVHRLCAQWLDHEQQQALKETGRSKGALQLESYGHIEFVLRVVDGALVLALRPQKGESDESASDYTHKVVRRINQAQSLQQMLVQSVLSGASDIVLSANRAARVRFGHGFFALDNHRLTSEEILACLGGKMNERKHELLKETGSADLAIDFAYDARSYRFRVNVFRQFDGLAAAWRPISDEIPDLESLLLPPEIKQIKRIDHGLVLISGPTGSGKSTTVASLIDAINREERRHIVTLEDPVEYRFVDALSMIHQREVGEHVDSFANGLRAALREAPNIIFVGEMRDLETISAALTAAETGHLVVSTLHSGSCIQALERIIDVFPEHQQQQVRVQLAEVLKLVVSQRLLPRIGSQLRVPACEILVANHAVSNLIRERRTHQIQSSLQIGKSQGMLSFEHSLLTLIEAGLVSPDVALSLAPESKTIQSMLGENG